MTEITPQEAAAHKQRIAQVFDQVSTGYDSPALCFFLFAADRVVTRLAPQPGWKVLDVATGTGHLAVALGQAVGASGRVMGIDLSEGMLARAAHNINKMALTNVDLFTMDAEAPDFRSAYFDAVTCGFGLFFLPDMARALAQWRRVVRPGGTVVFTSFTEQAFQPLLAQLVTDLIEFGVDMESRPLATERLKNPDTCRELLAEAGYADIEQSIEQVGYHLRTPDDWWELVWNAAMRGLVEQIEPERREEFRRTHLERVAARQTADGIWLGVEVIVTRGRRP
jgi:ubiquinone/menaquinone biosynthesis C-methylase UbiE